jgi:hypothetical protein
MDSDLFRFDNRPLSSGTAAADLSPVSGTPSSHWAAQAQARDDVSGPAHDASADREAATSKTPVEQQPQGNAAAEPPTSDESESGQPALSRANAIELDHHWALDDAETGEFLQPLSVPAAPPLETTDFGGDQTPDVSGGEDTATTPASLIPAAADGAQSFTGSLTSLQSRLDEAQDLLTDIDLSEPLTALETAIEVLATPTLADGALSSVSTALEALPAASDLAGEPISGLAAATDAIQPVDLPVGELADLGAIAAPASASVDGLDLSGSLLHTDGPGLLGSADEAGDGLLGGDLQDFDGSDLGGLF